MESDRQLTGVGFGCDENVLEWVGWWLRSLRIYEMPLKRTL